MTELKPCPFCGGEALTTYNTKFGFQVFCSNEKCFMNTIIMTSFDTEEQVIEAWNRRVEQ